MQEKYCEVLVIGGGIAGLSASISATENNAKVILIEREARLGGILKQCIHDGFGVVRYGEKLTGPEYAQRDIDRFNNLGIEALTLTYVTKITKDSNRYVAHYVSRQGVGKVITNKIILACGCRERTAKQVGIHGANPTGVLTAGTAQNYINLMGYMPTKRCVILGSGDIGLIMARRLTLEGAKVVGVYEVKPTSSGLTRNVVQCLNDFNIPLFLSHTVTKLYGRDRLEAVEIMQVDDKMQPIEGTSQMVECDSLILSVGLIPENEIATELGVPLAKETKGSIVDQTFMTMVDNIYTCGNAMHVFDLADYVSESGRIAGISSALPITKRDLITVDKSKEIAYIVPQRIDKNKNRQCVFYFRVANEYENMRLVITADEELIFEKKYQHLRPPEMERISVEINSDAHRIKFALESL